MFHLLLVVVWPSKSSKIFFRAPGLELRLKTSSFVRPVANIGMSSMLMLGAAAAGALLGPPLRAPISHLCSSCSDVVSTYCSSTEVCVSMVQQQHATGGQDVAEGGRDGWLVSSALQEMRGRAAAAVAQTPP